MKRFLSITSLIALIIFSIYLLLFSFQNQSEAIGSYPEPTPGNWVIQSVDTMKLSRDLSRERLGDPAFLSVIDETAKKISALGATHMSVATPYDEEFYPMLKLWVESGRKYGLSIWFRGNWSGWEGWFSYPAIIREQHIKKTENFIISHPEIFENNDIFTACPECENGGPGDPRTNGDIMGHREFLINENEMLKQSFNSIGKQVRYNFNSMNGDVAKLIMDKNTTKALGGLVTIDHYVETPEKLAADIYDIADISGGRVVLSEFGAPIPDIHGAFTQTEQNDWLYQAMNKLVNIRDLYAVNYWLGTGGSSELWNSEGVIKPAYYTLQKYYKPNLFHGTVSDELYEPIAGALVSLGQHGVLTDQNGFFVIKYLEDDLTKAIFSNEDYFKQEVIVQNSKQRVDVLMVKEAKDLNYKAREYFSNLMQK